jgi:hypothetical protein
MSHEPSADEKSPPAAHAQEHAFVPDPPWFNFLLATGLAAFLGAGIYSSANAPPEAAEGGGEALHLREEAAELTKDGHWADSLKKLAEAKALDPRGENDEVVERLRRLDEAHLRSLPPGETSSPPDHEPGEKAMDKPEKAADEAPHEGK